MLRIGWAVRDITPTRSVMLHGQMHRRIAREAIDPVLVTALAIEGGDPVDCAILISCDLCMVPEALQRAVRDQLASRLAVPAENIVLSATHTHTSLVVEEGAYEHPGGDVMTPAECAALVADRAADAGAEAWGNRSTHTIGRAFEHAAVGHNRRALYADGRAQMYGRTDRDDFVSIEGYEDHSLDLIFTWDAASHLTGVVLDLPCPAQVDENLEVVSADFWHDIRIQLRARLGESLQVLPFCGAAGDISPHFLLYGKQEAEMRRRRRLSERREIAARVAGAVGRAFAYTEPTGKTAFAHAVRRLELTARRASREERDQAAAEYERAAQDPEIEGRWAQRLRKVVESFDDPQSGEPVSVEVHVVRIGDAALATNPFELFLDYGLRIKARSAAAQTLVVQLAAGRAGYLPTERAVSAGGYGATPASSAVGPEGGQQLVEHTLDMIRSLFPSGD